MINEKYNKKNKNKEKKKLIEKDVRGYIEGFILILTKDKLDLLKRLLYFVVLHSNLY